MIFELDANNQGSPEGRLVLGMQAAIDLLRIEINANRGARGLAAVDDFRSAVSDAAMEASAQFLEDKLREIANHKSLSGHINLRTGRPQL